VRRGVALAQMAEEVGDGSVYDCAGFRHAVRLGFRARPEKREIPLFA
jgi:hypothetical protein